MGLAKRHIIALLSAALAAAGGCAGDRDTLLQLEVVVPAGGAPTTIEIEVASQVKRTYSGALPPPGTTLGIDLYLPRRLAGEQPVRVRALDSERCAVAETTITVTLQPGQRIAGGLVSLVALPARSCPPPGDGGDGTTDGGADVPAAREAGGDKPAPGVDSSGSDGGPGDGALAADAAREVGADAPSADAGPRRCTGGGECASTENCLAGTCQPASPSCADILQRSPGATDGVYLLATGGVVEPAYCDMRLKRVLCARTEGDHTGLTRDGALNGAGLTFTLRSVLEPPAYDVCRVWAVRHETAGPFVEPLGMLVGLDTAPDAKVKSTCEALGFKRDVDVRLLCYYGSLAHCGFSVEVVQRPNGRTVSKWANTCDCNPNKGRPFYALEDRVQVSHIPWNADGSNSARCGTR